MHGEIYIYFILVNRNGKPFSQHREICVDAIPVDVQPAHKFEKFHFFHTNERNKLVQKKEEKKRKVI